MNRISQTGKPTVGIGQTTTASLRKSLGAVRNPNREQEKIINMVENEIRQRERLDTNEDQIFSDGNRSPESSDEDDVRPRIDNFMVVEESKRNNNHRYSAGLGSTANAN